MRAKRTGRPSRPRPSDATSTPIDLGASARQIGLFESANGVPHGIVAILTAFALAMLLLPVRAAWRALTDRRAH